MSDEEEKKVKPLAIDISDWDQRPWFTRIHDVNIHLEAKGFCTIKTGLRNKVKSKAKTEVEELRGFGALDRVPKEALSCLLGETSSCWSMTLGPQRPGENSLATEAGLRQLEEHLHLIGDEISVASGGYMGFSLCGRLPLRLHHSKMPGDRGAPPIYDLNEAEYYIKQARQKRLVLLYYLGPGRSTMTLVPRVDEKRGFEASIHEECLLIYRTDVMKLSLETESQAIAVQMDFVARIRQAVIARSKELLPLPESIEKWYDGQLRARISKQRDIDDLPYHVKREAVQLYGKGPDSSMPVRVLTFWHDLPTIPLFSGKIPPFQAAVLGGLDCVTEIIKPSEGGKSIEDFGAKWDMNDYYDEDPKMASNFKMYTRHMSVLNRGHDAKDDYDILDFKISTLENLTIDPKHRMIAESTWKCIADANTEPGMMQNREVGFYVGISGGNDQYYQFLSGAAKIGKFTWNNMSNAAMVSRLSFISGSTGPCIAVDTEDSSGLGAVDTAVRDLRIGRCEPFAIASAVSYFSNPFQLIILCAAQLMSKTGRSRVYDETCDGYMKGEGVISAMLEPGGWESRPQDKNVPKGPLTGSLPRLPVGIRCLITGSACSAQGTSSALGIQSPFGMISLIEQCCKDAGVKYPYIDAVEVDASGRRMADIVELGVLINRSGLDDKDAYPVALRPHKAAFGNLGPCSGIVAICKSALLLEQGVHGPQIHLRQLLDLDGIPSEEGQPASRMLCLTEAIDARPKQTISVNSFSSTGTNLSVMLQGRVPEEDFLINKVTGKPTVRTTGKPIYWWPGGPQKEPKPPMRGYFIIGSWTNWEFTHRMEEEEEGVFGYTLTMGENNWENFQIWVDEDEDQVIHPLNPKDVKNSRVSAPEQCSKTLSWLIDGRNEKVRLVNEEQMKALESKVSGEERRVDPMLKGQAVTFSQMCLSFPEKSEVEQQRHWNELEEPEFPERPVVAYVGSHVPPSEQFEGSSPSGGLARMPVITLNQEDAAQPRDRFRIRLHARGKYKRVEWSRVKASDALDVTSDFEEYTHKYHIIGDHNYWTFHDMEADPAEPGLYTKVVHMLKDSTSFQVYRNADWEQGFFPRCARGSQSDEIVGPNGDGMGLNWTIEGKVGDLVRVEFRRSIVRGKDVKTIQWVKEGSEEVDFEAISKKHKWHVIGSFTDFQKTLELEKDEETGHLKVEITVGKAGKEYFQFLLDGNFLSALHPEFNEATMHDEDQSITGPDDEGSGRYWVIGLHPNDAAIGAGNHVFIHLDIEHGLPKRVWWEKYDSPDAHREYLAQGCWNTFDRHCRMLGFRPYQSETQKAVMIKAPQFVTMPAGTYKIDGPQI